MKILCIDGGGVFGYIPALFIASANGLFPKFDAYGGTSVGSILTLSYAQGRYPYEMEEFFAEAVGKIFHRPFFSRFNPFGAKYPESGINDSLYRWFGNHLFGKLEPHCVIPTYDFQHSKPKIYDNIVEDSDFYLKTWEIARMSSAAPTFFPPYNGKIDGGVIANNPVMVTAWALHSKLGVPYEEMEILSIGTGQSYNMRNGNQSTPRTSVGWLDPMLGLLTEGNEQIFEFGAKQHPFKKYIRFNPVPLAADWKFDDPDLIPAITEICSLYITEFKNALRKFNEHTSTGN